jgi:hypothetical protein
MAAAALPFIAPVIGSLLPWALDKLGSLFVRRGEGGRLQIEQSAPNASFIQGVNSLSGPMDMVVPNNSNVNQASLLADTAKSLQPVFVGNFDSLNDVATLVGIPNNTVSANSSSQMRFINRNKIIVPVQAIVPGNQIQFTINIPTQEIVDLTKIYIQFILNITVEPAATGNPSTINKILDSIPLKFFFFLFYNLIYI